MKEYTLYDRLEIIRNEVSRRPLSVNLNLLLFSYLALLKIYNELLDYSTLFTMSVLKPCTIGEDFRTIGYIAKGVLHDAEIQLKYIRSIDPEDPYTYLFEGLLKLLKGENPQESFKQALIFSGLKEREEIEQFLNIKADKEALELYNPPDDVADDTVEKTKIAIDNNPYFAPLKVNFAEILMKKRDIDGAKKKITAVISQYPYYPRAIALLTKIYLKMDKKEEAEFAMRNFLEINPLNPYVKEMENLTDKKESIEIEELKKLFETNNPLIASFKDLYKKIKGGELVRSEETLAKIEEEEIFEEKPVEGEQPLIEETTKEVVPQKEITEEVAPQKEIPEEIYREETKQGELEEKTIKELEKTEEKEIKEEQVPQKEELEGNHFDRAFKLLALKEYEQAIKEFLQALKEETINY